MCQDKVGRLFRAENATNGISWQSTKGTSPRVSHVFYFIESARIRVYLKVLHFESGLKRMEALPEEGELTVGFTNKLATQLPLLHKTDRT